MKRKIIVILLVLTLVLNSFSCSYANPIAVALGAKEIIVLGGLLVAGGLVYTNQDDIKRSATDFYYNAMTSEVRENFRASFDSIVDGVATFSLDVWESVRSFVSSGDTTLDDYMYTGDILYSFESKKYSEYPFLGHSFTVVPLGTNSDGTLREWRIAMDGRFVGKTFVEEVPSPVGGDTVVTYKVYKENLYSIDQPVDAPAPYINVKAGSNGELDIYFDYYDSDYDIDRMRMFHIDRYYDGTFKKTYYCAMRSLPVTTQSYAYTVVTDTTGWQSLDEKVVEDEKVEVFIPPTIDDLVDKNFRNPVSGDYESDFPTDEPIPGTDTGTDTGNAGILQNLKDILNSIKEILQYLNPESDKFLLKIAFVPSDGYFLNYVTEIKEAFFGKIPIFTQLFEFFKTVKDITVNGGKPKFEVTFPDSYGGGTYSIIDFSMFDQYQTFILNFIRFTAWFFFLKKLFRMLPYIVYK